MTFLPSSISFCAFAGRLQARIHQLALDLPVVLEIRERARVRDEGDDERPAERRLAERSHADARARLVERGEVVDDLLPARQMPVGAGLEAENRRGRRNRVLRAERGERCGNESGKDECASARDSDVRMQRGRRMGLTHWMSQFEYAGTLSRACIRRKAGSRRCYGVETITGRFSRSAASLPSPSDALEKLGVLPERRRWRSRAGMFP